MQFVLDSLQHLWVKDRVVDRAGGPRVAIPRLENRLRRRGVLTAFPLVQRWAIDDAIFAEVLMLPCKERQNANTSAMRTLVFFFLRGIFLTSFANVEAMLCIQLSQRVFPEGASRNTPQRVKKPRTIATSRT